MSIHNHDERDVCADCGYGLMATGDPCARCLGNKLKIAIEGLEWIAGKSDKPYCTYYERVLDDGTEVPTVRDVADRALARIKEGV